MEEQPQLVRMSDVVQEFLDDALAYVKPPVRAQVKRFFEELPRFSGERGDSELQRLAPIVRRVRAGMEPVADTRYLDDLTSGFSREVMPDVTAEAVGGSFPLTRTPIYRKSSRQSVTRREIARGRDTPLRVHGAEARALSPDRAGELVRAEILSHSGDGRFEQGARAFVNAMRYSCTEMRRIHNALHPTDMRRGLARELTGQAQAIVGMATDLEAARTEVELFNEGAPPPDVIDPFDREIWAKMGGMEQPIVSPFGLLDFPGTQRRHEASRRERKRRRETAELRERYVGAPTDVRRIARKNMEALIEFAREELKETRSRELHREEEEALVAERALASGMNSPGRKLLRSAILTAKALLRAEKPQPKLKDRN